MTAFTYPLVALCGGGLALLVLLAGLWAQARPGLGVRVVRQKPALQGLGMALILAGAGLGLAEPRWGLPEVPRLTVHVVVDASRSMLVPDCGGKSRWHEAELLLERLWSKPTPGIRYSLTLRLLLPITALVFAETNAATSTVSFSNTLPPFVRACS